MKQIRKFIIITLLFTSILNVTAQSRTNNNGNSISINTVGEKLRTSTGWKQDFSGAWVSNNNSISDVQLQDANRNSVLQNFNWLQFVLIKASEQDFYAILYENEILTSNRALEKKVNYFVMSVDDYSKILQIIKEKSGKTLTITSPMYGFMDETDGFSTSKLLTSINGSLTSTSSNQFAFSINAQHVDRTDVVRFRLPELVSAMRNTGLEQGYFENNMVDFDKILLAYQPSLSSEFDLSNNVKAAGAYTAARPSSNTQALEKNEGSDFSVRTNTTTDKPQLQDEPLANVKIVDSIHKDQLPENAQSDVQGSDGRVHIEERVNKEKPVLSQPIANITEVSGHYYDDEKGEWVESDSPSYKFETTGGFEWRNFTYKGVEYLLLTKYQKYAGADHYLLLKEDYVKALTDLPLSAKANIRVILKSAISDTVEEMITKAQEEINKPRKENEVVFTQTKLVLQYKMSDAKNLARFYMYFEDCSRYGSEKSPETCNPNPARALKYSDVSLLGTDKLLNKMYFETTFELFYNFLRQPMNQMNM